jgi:tetratricopeptide (TPR) repeat protein
MTTRRTDVPEHPPRLADQPATGDPTVDRAARLMRQLQAPPRLQPAVDARLDRRVAELSRPPTHRRKRWPLLVAGALVLFGGAAMAARYRPAPLRRLMAVILPAPRPSAPVVRHQAPAPVVEPTPAPLPVVEVAPASERTRPVRPRPAPRVAIVAPRPERAVPVAAPSALADESALLGRALGQLRRQNNPAAALATLDDYEGRFPRGVMAFEALAARVEALVKLGRTEVALGRLDAVAPVTLAKSPALRVVRGELRARAGRLAAAIEDFDVALGREGGGDLFERALYGRGSCRARQGDTAGARQDLERYLRLFPQGRFAAEARQVLGR